MRKAGDWQRRSAHGATIAVQGHDIACTRDFGERGGIQPGAQLVPRRAGERYDEKTRPSAAASEQLHAAVEEGMSLAAARWSQKADVTILRLYEAALNIVEKNAHQWSGRMKKLFGRYRSRR
jgi:hypothetical protein